MNTCFNFLLELSRCSYWCLELPKLVPLIGLYSQWFSMSIQFPGFVDCYLNVILFGLVVRFTSRRSQRWLRSPLGRWRLLTSGSLWKYLALWLGARMWSPWCRLLFIHAKNVVLRYTRYLIPSQSSSKKIILEYYGTYCNHFLLFVH